MLSRFSRTRFSSMVTNSARKSSRWDDLDSHLAQAEFAGRAQSAVPGKKLVGATVGCRQQEERVKQTDGPHGLQKVVQFHVLAAMVPVRDDLDAVDGDQQGLHGGCRLCRGGWD